MIEKAIETKAVIFFYRNAIGFLIFETIDAILIMHRLQDKCLAKRRYLNLEKLGNLYVALVHLEKAFDSVSRAWFPLRR